MAVNWNAPKASPAPLDLLSLVPRARAAKAAGRAAPAFEHLADRVRAEYREMPGLNLTRDQACCLWGLERELCDRVLLHLVNSGFLTRTGHATYVRADGG
jgi:hypothetical protein